MFQKISGIEIFYAEEGEHDFVSETFCLTVPKNFVRAPFVSQEISLSKIVMDRKGISRFSLEIFLSHSTEIFRRETLCLSEIFWYRKFWKIRGGYHYLASKIFFLTVPENFVKEQLCVSKNFWYRKFLCRRGGTRFCVGNFLSHSTKKFRRGALLCQKISGLKILHKIVYHDFVENWFSHSTENFRRRTLHSSENFFYRKFFWVGRGYHDFLSKLFCLTVPKKFLVGPFCFRNFQDWKNCIRWCITNLSKNDFLTVPKSFVGEPFVFQEVSSIEKLYG